MVSKRFLTSGGGAPEIELSRQLGAWVKILHGMECFCVKFFVEALWLFPYTLAGNAGLNPININLIDILCFCSLMVILLSNPTKFIFQIPIKILEFRKNTLIPPNLKILKTFSNPLFNKPP